MGRRLQHLTPSLGQRELRTPRPEARACAARDTRPANTCPPAPPGSLPLAALVRPPPPPPIPHSRQTSGRGQRAWRGPGRAGPGRSRLTDGRGRPARLPACPPRLGRDAAAVPDEGARARRDSSRDQTQIAPARCSRPRALPSLPATPRRARSCAAAAAVSRGCARPFSPPPFLYRKREAGPGVAARGQTRSQQVGEATGPTRHTLPRRGASPPLGPLAGA